MASGEEWQDEAFAAALWAAEEASAEESAGEVCPNIYELFAHYNALYFNNKLGACTVEWSSGRMTLCGGNCEMGTGSGCRVKLSEPLLKFRPSSDLKMVLLHELIHAYCFLEYGYADHDGHGPPFLTKAKEINESTVYDPQRPPGGYNITVYHSFHDEVEHYRKHHWKCQKCGILVKRAMNRPPTEKDCREYRKDTSQMQPCRDPRCAHHSHLLRCGGAFEKIAGPDPKEKPFSRKRPNPAAGAAAAGRGIAKYFAPLPSPGKGRGEKADASLRERLPAPRAATAGASIAGGGAATAAAGDGAASAGTRGQAAAELQVAAAAAMVAAQGRHLPFEGVMSARERCLRAAEARVAAASGDSGDPEVEVIGTFDGCGGGNGGSGGSGGVAGILLIPPKEETDGGGGRSGSRSEGSSLSPGGAAGRVSCPVCDASLENDLRKIDKHMNSCLAA